MPEPIPNRSRQLFQKYLRRPWYVQGFSAVPIFLSTAAISGTWMKKYLGFGYRHFLFSYYDGYGEMAYDPGDFKRLWKIIKEKLRRDSKYLEKIKALYFRNLQRYQPFLRQVRSAKLADLSEAALLRLFRELILAQVDYVGVAHIIEPIGIEIEEEFKALLRQELPPEAQPRFNAIFSALITPGNPSFIKRAEVELLALRGGIKDKTALARYAAKYYWLQNSYAGPQNLTAADFRKKFISLRREKNQALKAGKNGQIDAAAILRTHKFSPELKAMRRIIDFCAIWQDERKALLFKNISLAGFVINELARRLKQPVTPLYYLGLSEIQKLRTLDNLRAKLPALRERQRGCLILIKGLSDFIISGPAYRRLLAGRRGLLKATAAEQDLHGTVANTGTASGRVRLVKNMASLKKFQKGEVLVASMTRPEYLSAIKKAAAIVTDEGGITCHAAIIARELNIPCVIGTKIATQILRDGMRAEVRANHGLVRIIK